LSFQANEHHTTIGLDPTPQASGPDASEFSVNPILPVKRKSDLGLSVLAGKGHQGGSSSYKRKCGENLKL
jgi:hypothetical protein